MLLGDGMPRAYSGDLRGSGDSRCGGRLIGARGLEVGESTATAWVGRWRRTGSSEAKSQKGRSRSPLAAHTSWLLALITEQTDLTLEEIGERLAARGVRAAVSSIWRFYDRHGISIKKTVHAAEQRCPDVASARHHWKSSSRSLTPKSWLSTVLRARFG